MRTLRPLLQSVRHVQRTNSRFEVAEAARAPVVGVLQAGTRQF